MNTLELNAPEKFIRKAQKLPAIADELKPFLELLSTFDGKDTIGEFVKAGLLTPPYVNFDQRRFWLSEVMKLPQNKQWHVKR